MHTLLPRLVARTREQSTFMCNSGNLFKHPVTPGCPVPASTVEGSEDHAVSRLTLGLKTPADSAFVSLNAALEAGLGLSGRRGAMWRGTETSQVIAGTSCRPHD